MNERCEPPPEHQDKPWHRIRFAGDDPVEAMWCVDEWAFPGHESGLGLSPENIHAAGFRYVGPCQPPEAATSGSAGPDVVRSPTSSAPW